MCVLVELYILSLLQKRVNKKDNGLYRDEGLVVLRNANGRTTDFCRKYIISIFKTHDFNINILTNLKIVDFLDVAFNLENCTYHSFKKPNDKLLYVHTSSNHPPQIIRQIPSSVFGETAKKLIQSGNVWKIKSRIWTSTIKKWIFNKIIIYQQSLSQSQHKQQEQQLHVFFQQQSQYKQKALYNLVQPVIQYECEKQYWEKLLATNW